MSWMPAVFDLKPTIAFDGEHNTLIIAISLFLLAISFFILKATVLKKPILHPILSLFKPGPRREPDRRRVIDIVVKVTEIVTKITEIKIRTTLFEQMMYAEQKLIILQSMMLHKYALLLNKRVKKGVGDVTGHEDYLFFNNLLSLTLNNSKNTIREIIQHTHFDEYSDEGFRQYIRERAEVILAQAVQFIWSMYPASKMEITFFELDEMIRDEHDDFRDVIVDIFAESIKIYRIKKVEIDALKHELDDYIGDDGD